MNTENKEDFNEWWNLVGSNQVRSAAETEEEFAKRIAFRSWAACIDINNIEDN